jgi:hypothetical protein
MDEATRAAATDMAMPVTTDAVGPDVAIPVEEDSMVGVLMAAEASTAEAEGMVEGTANGR